MFKRIKRLLNGRSINDAELAILRRTMPITEGQYIALHLLHTTAETHHYSDTRNRLNREQRND